MNVGNYGYSQQYLLNSNSPKLQNEHEKIKSSENVGLSPKIAKIDEAKLTETIDTTETKSEDPASKIKSFAYGVLGLDHPDTVEKNRQDTAYTAGKYVSGLRAIGSILSVIV